MKQKAWFSRTAVYLLTTSLAMAFVWTASADARALCVGKKRKSASAKNRAAASDYCRRYKAKNPGAECIVDKRICPRGYAAKKKFRGCGANYSSCVKGRKIPTLKDRKNKGKEKAAAWCNTYSSETGKSCKYVKTARMCPRGYRRYTKVKGAKIRNYKICVVGDKFGPRKDQVGNKCTARMASDSTKALDWIASHYNNVTGNFEISRRKRRDSRIKARLSRKLRKVKVICHPKNNRMCKRKKDSVTRGQANGRVRRVHMCFKNIDTFCDFVGVLFHEVAHVAGVPRSPLWVHNNPNNPKRLLDDVYQLGIRATAACEADPSVTNYRLNY